MTITQTVNISDDHRLRFDMEIPRDIPTGETQVLIQFPVVNKTKSDNESVRFTRKELDEMIKNSPHTQAISGILSGMGDIDLDEYRMKRLAKHL